MTVKKATYSSFLSNVYQLVPQSLELVPSFDLFPVFVALFDLCWIVRIFPRLRRWPQDHMGREYAFFPSVPESQNMFGRRPLVTSYFEQRRVLFRCAIFAAFGDFSVIEGILFIVRQKVHWPIYRFLLRSTTFVKVALVLIDWTFTHPQPVLILRFVMRFFVAWSSDCGTFGEGGGEYNSLLCGTLISTYSILNYYFLCLRSKDDTQLSLVLYLLEFTLPKIAIKAGEDKHFGLKQSPRVIVSAPYQVDL